MSKLTKASIYLKNKFRNIDWKIKYGSSISVANKQLFDNKPLIKVFNNGSITIGKQTSNRGRQFFICDGGKMTIGDGCFFNDGCSVTCMDHLTIGDGCTFANNVVIVDHDHDYRKIRGGYKASPVSIGNNVWVGANSVILRGVKIGDNCVIAAGTVVIRGAYPANSLIKNDKKLSIKPITR